MNWLLLAVGMMLLALALLVARGAYLIGNGTEAELEARKRMDSHTSRTGWNLLWRLRNGRVPIVSAIEEKLGWNREDEVDDDTE